MRYLLSSNPTPRKGDIRYFSGLQTGVTQGDSEQEAVEMAVDALEMIVSDYIKRRKLSPAPSKLCGRKHRTIRLPGLQSAKVELNNAF